MKPSDISAILGTGGKSSLILPTSGLFGNLSMVRWLEHLFLFCPCEIQETTSLVFLCCLLQRQTMGGTSLLVLLLLFTAGVIITVLFLEMMQ